MTKSSSPKRIRDRLKAREAASLIRDPLFVLGPDRRILDWNRAAARAMDMDDTLPASPGHSSAFELQDAIVSAANECFRAAHSAIQFDSFAEVAALHAGGRGTISSPAAHSLAYAYKEMMPEVVKILTASEIEVRRQWRTHQLLFNELNLAVFDAQTFQVGDRIVARVKSPKYREIFWGRTDDVSKRNQHPHFVG